MVCLITSPLFSLAEGRDFSKYTSKHNEITVSKLADEIYEYIKTIPEKNRTIDYRNSRDITISVFSLIDKYSCNKDLFILNRGVQTKPREGKISFIGIQIFLMNATGLIDTVVLSFDIDRVKAGEPLKKKTDKIQV